MDSDQDTHREHAAQRQAIIAEVVRTHAGEPIPQIMDLLQERMADRGLQPPPGKWLEAVARDASAGRTYVESNEAMADSGTDDPLAATRGARPGQQENSGGGPRPEPAWHRPPRVARSATTRTDHRRTHAAATRKTPTCPLPHCPDEVAAMLARPNHAVIASSRPDGQPVSVATWYLYEKGRVLVNMDEGRRRLAYLRADPRVSLTAMDPDDWYTHVSVQGRIVAVRGRPRAARHRPALASLHRPRLPPTGPRPGQRVDRDRHLARVGRPQQG